jgi:ubiquinol-cytochrome c reductase cytochrome c subunit
VLPVRAIVASVRAWAVALGAGLAAVVLLAASAPAQDPLVDRGRELYADGCVGCHGPDGRGRSGLGPPLAAGGVQGAGPSLHGVGAASAHLYLTTGYMPLDNPHEPPERRDPQYSPREIDALVAYVGSLGGGGPPIPDVDPRRGSLAEGRAAFTKNCSGCHQVVAEGGVIVDGVAPELEQSTPTQVAEAIRVGSYLMPRFGEAQISEREVDSIARYVQWAQSPRDEGGWGIGHIGPIPEGLMAWLFGGLALVAVARVIGKRLS